MTRTDRLLDQAKIKADALRAAGNFEKDLLDHWQCHDSRCKNQNGWCFVDFSGKHYNMDHSQQALWAKAIANGDANVLIYRSPTSLYNFWTGNQGAVMSNSRRSIQKQEREQERESARADREEGTDFMAKFMAFNKQQLEMRLAESMSDSIERMASRQEQRRPPPSYPPIYHESAYTSSSIQPSQQGYHPSASYANSFHPQPTQPTQLPRTHSPVSQLSSARSSSPIDVSDEEYKVVEEFFEWKKTQTHKATWKDKIAEVQRIADTNMWTVKHLKVIEDPLSQMYRIAIQMGVSDTLARGFRKDLKDFKSQWRQAKALMTLGQHI